MLALIEYGERGRTNLLQQVKPNDVVFLYRRKEQGHTFGYIGAFKVTGNKVFDNPDRKSANELLKGDKEKYDMYDAIDDGATTVANLEVKPIAYNCKGVECMSPKLKTIQRMYKYEEISYLLNRFAGQDLDNNRLSGKGKLDENRKVEIKDSDKEYFEKIRKEIEEICKENNLN